MKIKSCSEFSLGLTLKFQPVKRFQSQSVKSVPKKEEYDAAKICLDPDCISSQDAKYPGAGNSSPHAIQIPGSRGKKPPTINY